MVTEIEKKYLIREDGQAFHREALFQHFSWLDEMVAEVQADGQRIRQGYLPLTKGAELAAKLGFDLNFEAKEARLRNKAGTCYFTVKGEGNLERRELETRVDRELFEANWSDTKGRRVEKIRLSKAAGDYTLELDFYTDRDLIVAEIEFPNSKLAEAFPPLGRDVTCDNRYKNKNLAR